MTLEPFVDFYQRKFQGDNTSHLLLKDINKTTGKKEVITLHFPFPFKEHLEGKKVCGLSPVDLSKRVCRWIGLDHDELGDEKKKAKELYSIDQEAHLFYSTNKKFHIYKFFDEPVEIKEAQEQKDKLMKKLKDLGWKFDEKKCLPQSFNLKENKPGNKLFLPRFLDQSKCISPRGNLLDQEKFQLKEMYKKHPLISGIIGMKSNQGSRADALFCSGLYLKHTKIEKLKFLYTLNEFLGEPLDVSEVDHVVEDSLPKEDYSLGHLINNYSKYTEQLFGISLEINKTLYKLLSDGNYEDILKKYQKPNTPGADLRLHQNIVLIKKEDSFFDLGTWDTYKEGVINKTFQHDFKTKPVYEWSKNENKNIVEQALYKPEMYKPKEPIFEQEGKLYLNSYKPGGVPELRPEDCQTYNFHIHNFKELTEFIWSVDEECRWVLDFASTIFQKPGKKIRHIILNYTKQKQTGRSTWFKILKAGLGEKNCEIISPVRAIDKSKEYVTGKQLILIDEIRISGSDHRKSVNVMNTIKDLATEEDHQVRKLFTDWQTVKSNTNYMMTSNFPDAITVDEKEERYMVSEGPRERHPLDLEFYSNFWSQDKNGLPIIDPDLAGCVKHFLRTRKITDYDDLPKEEQEEGQKKLFTANGTALKTEAFYEMCENTSSNIVKDIKNFIEEREPPFRYSVISSNEAYRYFQKHYSFTGSTTDFKEALEEAKCERRGHCMHKKTGKTPVLYICRNQNAFKDIQNGELADRYWLPVFSMEEISEGDKASIKGMLEKIEEGKLKKHQLEL